MRKLCCIVILLITLTFTGCWNYKEISDRDIVVGVAVDYDDLNNRLLQTVEVAAPQLIQGQTQIKSKKVECTGKDFFDAARNAIAITGKKLFWSHTKTLILGKTAINNEDVLVSTLDYIKRDAEPRDNMWVVMAKGVDAKDIILESDVEVQSIVSMYLDEIFKNQDDVSKYYGVRLWQFIDNLGEEGISPVLPTVQIHEENGVNVCEARGMAVFKGTEFKGYLNGDETLFYMMASDNLEGGILVIEHKFDNKDTRVSLEIYDCKTKIKPMIKKDKLSVVLDIELKVEIGEISNDVDVISKKNRYLLAEVACDKIKKDLTSLFRKVQKQYNADIFGYGRKFSISYPKEWEQLKTNWGSTFKSIDINFNCHVEIIGSAFRSKPIKIGE